MTEAELTSYEELPYSRHPFATSHPDTLATVARLYGLEAPSTTSCRVLELGCASGGNLVPMAAGLPQAQFLGIDLSPRQIAQGQELIDATGVTNVQLRALDIMQLGPDFGTFDYILCHGVYSWVPPPVQEKIFEICARHLAPQGLAYISYNTYPGWHQRGMVRDMLNYHARPFEGIKTKLLQTRAFLAFLDEFVRAPESCFGRYVKIETDLLRDESDTYLFHEHLEDFNNPVYFHEFAGRFAAHGLQYVGEALPCPLLGNLPDKVQRILKGMGRDRIDREQYRDFISGRLFRRSILCHAGLPVLMEPSLDVIPSLRASPLVKAVNPNPDVTSEAVEEFRGEREIGLTTKAPIVKTALVTLYEAWPRALTFDELWARIEQRLAPVGGAGATRERLVQVLLSCYEAQLADLHTCEPQFVTHLSERPIASPVARVLALTEQYVPNQRHLSLKLDDFERIVLAKLDGTRDRAALLETIAESVAQGELEFQAPDGSAGIAVDQREVIEENLGACLEKLAKSALLVG
jgi:methyltransferase-like protein/ubiquinone/menaquinone biosynthesis C-methylase UbiE